MSLQMNNRVVLVKPETTYGTDSTPTGAANAMLVSNLDINPLAGDSVSRDFIRNYFGSSGNIRVSNFGEVNFDVELAGATGPGVAPPWGACMKACGFAETIVATTSVTYLPISTFASNSSVSIYFYMDGVRHILVGARGNVSFEGSAMQIPKLKFTFKGLLGTVTDNSASGVSFTPWQVPATVSTANTTGLSIHGTTGMVMKTFNFDMANEVNYRQLVGAESVIISNRKPTGNISIEATTVAVKDWWTPIKAATQGAFAINYGALDPAGRKFAITAPKMQLLDPKYSDDNGITMLDMGLQFIPNAGNDEVSIAIT